MTSGASPRRVRPLEDKLAIGLLIVLAEIILLTFYGYGMTFDEPAHMYFGDMLVRYYHGLLGGPPNDDILHYGAAPLYGALVDLTTALVSRISPMGRVETSHLIYGVFGWFGCFGTWKLARAMGGVRAGLIALILIVTTPRYYGDMFANPKDVPFAATYVWSLYYLMQWMRAFPRIPTALALASGAAIGLGLAIRVGGLLLVCYLLLAVLLLAISERLAGEASLWHGLRAQLRPLLVAGLLAYAIMLVFWPYAQQSPLLNPLRALAQMSSFNKADERFLFQGEFIRPDHMPARYLPSYFVVTTPEVVLLIVIAGAILGGVLLRRAQGASRAEVAAALRAQRRSLCQITVLVTAIFFPPCYIIVKHAVIFNAIRHVLFVVPPMIVATALIADAVLERITGRLRLAAIAAFACGVLWTVKAMVELHPYQYTYFNQLAGGLRGALGYYETDYWSASYREAVYALHDYLEASDPDSAHKTYRVFVGDPPLASYYYAPPNFQPVAAPALADFTIANVRHNLNQYMRGRVVATVQRQGATLAYVHDRRALGATAQSAP